MVIASDHSSEIRRRDVAIIAPFIKVEALTSLLEVVPSTSHLRCVTRWLPREVADGVSDPEVFDVLEETRQFHPNAR